MSGLALIFLPQVCHELGDHFDVLIGKAFCVDSGGGPYLKYMIRGYLEDIRKLFEMAGGGRRYPYLPRVDAGTGYIEHTGQLRLSEAPAFP